MIPSILIAAALAVPGPHGEQVTEISQAHYGDLELVEERHEFSSRAARPLHGRPDLWFELHMRFPVEGTGIALIDDGTSLSFQLWSAQCSTSAPTLAYQGRIGEPRLFAQLIDTAASHFRECSDSTPASERGAMAVIRANRENFAAAVQAMKARAETLFQGWQRRCRPLPQPRGRDPVIVMPDPNSPCPGGVL
jgi:hypothetical protein